MSEITKPNHGHEFEGFDMESGKGVDGKQIHSALLAGLLLAGLLTMATMSNLLRQEVRGLPPGALEDRIVSAGEDWHRAMSEWRIDQPVAYIESTIEEWQTVSWAEVECVIDRFSQPGEPGDGCSE